jgi:hypothetical protein
MPGLFRSWPPHSRKKLKTAKYHRSLAFAHLFVQHLQARYPYLTCSVRRPVPKNENIKSGVVFWGSSLPPGRTVLAKMPNHRRFHFFANYQSDAGCVEISRIMREDYQKSRRRGRFLYTFAIRHPRKRQTLTLGLSMLGFGTCWESMILGVWAGPAAGKPLPKGGVRSAPTFGGVSGPQRPPRLQKPTFPVGPKTKYQKP